MLWNAPFRHCNRLYPGLIDKPLAIIRNRQLGYIIACSTPFCSCSSVPALTHNRPVSATKLFSRSNTMVTKNIEDKLEGLEVNGKHDSNETYIYVQSQDKGMDTTISVSATEQWEHELLQDPKVVE